MKLPGENFCKNESIKPQMYQQLKKVIETPKNTTTANLSNNITTDLSIIKDCYWTKLGLELFNGSVAIQYFCMLFSFHFKFFDLTRRFFLRMTVLQSPKWRKKNIRAGIKLHRGKKQFLGIKTMGGIIWMKTTTQNNENFIQYFIQFSS